ncbi:hypothetical protein FDI13_gp085 [Mycobacterium phage Spartacus]|uniref:Uncharacterized protein n=1 Tax=Mycobacterium phage Spartacus TaxID=1147141 RepID=H6WSI7_9CAUD|nr:hypothetical protein FDI13_gp085 [Mycobacterium phage Spartacus]AFA45093.1 hypothetical protein SPARTACUS_85 [Mycobacterium phage Spartacus]
MTHELRDVLTEALVEASYDYWYEKQTLGVDSRGKDVCAYLVDRLLSLPGVAVIQLPEPDHVVSGDEFENGRKDYALGDVSVFDDGEIHLFGAVWKLSDVDHLAAALLAAAAVAEGEDK